MRDEPAGTSYAARETTRDLRNFGGGFDRRREVERFFDLRRSCESARLLERPPSALGARRCARNQDDSCAFPARREDAGQRIRDSGAGRGEDDHGLAARERGLGGREGRAALVTEVEKLDRAVFDRAAKRNDRPTKDAESVGDAEAVEDVDERGRHGLRRSLRPRHDHALPRNNS